MNAVSVYREQLQAFHDFLEGTMQDVTTERAHWVPPGTANPIGANYAHAVMSVDMAINGLLKGGAPLAVSRLATKTGIGEPPPGGIAFGPWGEWAHRVRIDLAALRQYAQAVYAAADEYLASLTDEALGRPIDLSAVGFGQQTASWVLNNMLQNVALHCGEISCLKGLQGAKGYPA